MKVLVTGGAGFIGSNFVRYWLKNHPHDTVVNFDALTYAGNLESLRDLTVNPETKDRYQFIHGDITDPIAVREAMRGVDLVAHFAANSHVDRSIVEPGNFVNTNVVGTQVLLEEAKNAGVWRFHHVSTDEVYGTLTVEGDELFTEETRYQPNNPYSASKASSDCIVRAYYKTYDFPATITNTSNNFGAYQFPEKFIPLCITRLIDGKNIRLHGKGDHIRDWLYVEDHCRAIEQVLRRGKLGEVYLVAGRAQLSILEVAQRICKIMGVGEDRIEFVPDRPSNDKAYKLDWSKINRELGWEPLFSFDEWLIQTIDWYRNNEAWWRPLVKQSFAWGSTGHTEEEDSSGPKSVTIQTPSQQPSYGNLTINSENQSGVVNNFTQQHTPTSFKEVADAKKKVLIFGNGQMGMHFQKHFVSEGAEVVVFSDPEVDIVDPNQVRAVIDQVKPNLVINCVGVTNVDWSETHQEETYAVNVRGAENIARVCLDNNLYLVHISTGYVQQSRGAADEKSEQDPILPINYYSHTKAKADESLEFLAKQGLKVLIVRPNLLLSAVPHPKNVLAKMLLHTKFHDTANSMTTAEDLVVATAELVAKQKTGIYNVVNSGVTSPYKIACMLKEIVNPDMQIEKISKEEVEKMYTVRRPDTVLSTAKLTRESIVMPEINQRLRDLITILRDNLQTDSAKQAMKIAALEDQSKIQNKQDQVISNLFNKR